MKEPTRMKARETMVAVALCALAGASAFGAIETLTVPQGETAVRDAAYRWYTNTALTVSGTLDFSVAGPYVLCAVAADGTYDADGKKKPTMQLAPHAGDEGVLNITNGTALGTQVGVTFGSHLTVGAQGGGAQARINIGVDGTTKTSSYCLDTLLLHAGAQTVADEFRLVTIGYKAALELLKLQNDTAKPLVVAFTNDVADAPASDSALLRQFYDSSPFAPSKQAGGDIVLRGEPRSPIRLSSWGPHWTFFRDSGAKANLVTEGACDFIVQCPEKGVTLNLTNVVWRHAGDTVLIPRGEGAFFRVQRPHVLPWGAQTGVVKVRTDTKGTAVTLNLNGHDQKVNGLVVEAPSRVANIADDGVPAKPATLTFGAGDTDGVLVGAVEDGTISCVKEGAGALTLSNATVRALTVTNGVLKVFPGTVNRIGTLVLTNAALEVALDAQLEVETFVHDDALVDAVAIRAKATNEMTVATRALYPFTKIEKTGAAFHTMTLPPRANGAALHVKEGVLRLGGSACTNAWWRFIAKKASIEKRTDTWNGKTLVSTLFLGTIGLFTPSGLPSLGVTDAHGADNHPDADALAPGWAASCNRWIGWGLNQARAYFGTDIEHDPVLTGGSASSPIYFLKCYGDDGTNHYDGTRQEDYVANWYGTVMFTNRVLKADDAATWETIYWRARDAARQPVTCYALRRGVNMNAKTHPCPSDWKLETSPDGVVWTTLDARAGERAWEIDDAGSTKLNAQFSFTYNNHIPYLFRALRADWKFLDFGAVRVDAGATLDVEELHEANIAFNRLAVDCAGAGTITTFRPAANGRLDVTTVAGTGLKGLPRRLILPLTFGRLVAAENLASWSVYVDGERSFASAVGVDGGRLAVTTANGTVLILR